MTANGWFQIGLYLFVIALVTKPMGAFMTRVFNRDKTFLDPILRPIEQLVYRLTGVDERREMRWTEYAIAMLLFSGVSMALLYIIERTQRWLPFNPQKFANVEPALAFGTAASFTTNTNWQAYSGESTMSYLTQMAGLAYHNFASAAVGIVLAIVVIRGIARKETDKLGNFWVDTTRCLLWVLLPVCLGPRVPRCRAEFEALYDGGADSAVRGAGRGCRRQEQCANRDSAGDRARTGCLAGGNQGIRYQRGWIFQC